MRPAATMPCRPDVAVRKAALDNDALEALDQPEADPGHDDQMDDPFDLARFLAAQDPVLDIVRAELRAGRKRSHWMWFVFPQLAGLGHSAMARHYAIASLAEARAYLAHPVLGPRLIDCTSLVNQVAERSVHEIFGSPDDLKFHSSMTLFAAASPDMAAFDEALHRYFHGIGDRATTDRLPP